MLFYEKHQRLFGDTEFYTNMVKSFNLNFTSKNQCDFQQKHQLLLKTVWLSFNYWMLPYSNPEPALLMDSPALIYKTGHTDGEALDLRDQI